jgi:hypothetical protein
MFPWRKVDIYKYPSLQGYTIYTWLNNLLAMIDEQFDKGDEIHGVMESVILDNKTFPLD